MLGIVAGIYLGVEKMDCSSAMLLAVKSAWEEQTYTFGFLAYCCFQLFDFF